MQSLSDYSGISCVITAAGLSERMGKPKALLQHTVHHTFLSAIVKAYCDAGIIRVACVYSQPEVGAAIDVLKAENYCIIPVLNSSPESGRLQSVRLGMMALGKSEAVFIQNIDNPFITSETILKMCQLTLSAKVVVPKFNNSKGHPVLVSADVCEDIFVHTGENERLDLVLKAYRQHMLETNDASVLININTPEDYFKYYQRYP